MVKFQDPRMATRSSSSSDSEESSTVEDVQVTTRTERLIKKYQIKRSLILERIFAIDQDNEGLVKRIMEVEELSNDALSHRKSIMARLDTYGDDYRSVPVVIPSESEVNSSVSAAARGTTATQPSNLIDKKASGGGKKRKLIDAATSAATVAPSPTTTAMTTSPETDTKQPRPPRDKSLPKRPHNAFFYFSQERRSSLQKEFPHLNKKEIASILTQKWNELPVPEKEVYIQLQNERKHQYQMIMAQYNELNKESQI